MKIDSPLPMVRDHRTARPLTGKYLGPVALEDVRDAIVACFDRLDPADVRDRQPLRKLARARDRLIVAGVVDGWGLPDG